MENNRELLPLIEKYIAELHLLEAALKEEDRERLNAELKRSREKMNRLRR